MEVAARGAGGSLTPDDSRSGTQEEQGDGGRGNLNSVLYVAVVLCLGVIVVLGAIMRGQFLDDRPEGDTSGAWYRDVANFLTDQRVDATTARIGEDVGGGTVQAMDLAPEDEQVRAAAQIESATKMVNAFLNIQYQNVEANIEAVKALATGSFLKQYNHAAKSLVRLTRKAQATQTGEVVWAGLVSGDQDSADVVLATNGSVANKSTDYKLLARSYRLQLHLELVDGQWLTSDFQYVN